MKIQGGLRCDFRVAATAVVLACALMASLASGADDSKQNAVLSNEPLTQEQIAVYRAVLEDYTKDDKAALNLADTTEPLELSTSDTTCVKGIKLDKRSSSAGVVHKLDAKIAPDLKLVLVAPELQQQRIDQNDPQNLVKSAIDGGQHVTDEQVENAVRTAFDSGLFTFSEIEFDKGHRRAVVTYSFVCGRLCGHGNTVVLEKTGEKWKVKKNCGGWVS